MSNRKVMCITGASSGIGLATALLFSQKGWEVYAGTRNVERDRTAYKQDHLHFFEMEVTDPDSLEKVFSIIREDQGHIDVLFANAGYGLLKALGQASQKDIEDVFNTNVYGVIHTIKGSLSLLKASDNPYIIATSSVGGLVGQPFNEIYCATKFAVEGLLESLATYYKSLYNIDITLLEPGSIATNFGSTVYKNIESSGGIKDDEYAPLLKKYISTFQERTTKPQTADSVAEVVADLVSQVEKPLRVRTSETAEFFTRFKTEQDPDGLKGLRNTRKLHLNIND